MQEDAKHFVFDNFPLAISAKWVGNKTETENCDIIINDKHIEIKYVSSGNGTYYNTSLYCLEKYGFDIHKYLEESGIFLLLEEYQIPYSKTNKSPVNQTTSSHIRHNNPTLYQKIEELDQQMRSKLVNDLALFFNDNMDLAYDFYDDLINKNISKIKKSKPDELWVYNYIDKTSFLLDLSTKSNIQVMSGTNLGLTLNNLRIQIGWQNGNGLNNPTIRVFLI